MQTVASFADADSAVTYALKAAVSVATHASPRLIAKYGSAVTVDKRTLENPVIVFDIDATVLREDNTAIEETVKLLKRLRSLGAKIIFITARHPSMRDVTVRELQGIGINTRDYDRLLISPQSSRRSMKTVGDWKASARQAIAAEFRIPVLLTVGDQWTDIVTVRSDRELAQLDEAYGTRNKPYVLVLPNDGISILGLKLAAD